MTEVSREQGGSQSRMALDTTGGTGTPGPPATAGTQRPCSSTLLQGLGLPLPRGTLRKLPGIWGRGGGGTGYRDLPTSKCRAGMFLVRLVFLFKQ